MIDTCSNVFKDTLVFHLSQLRKPDSVCFTVNGYGHDTMSIVIPLCEDTLSFMANAVGNYDSFIIVLERGILDPNADTLIPDPNIGPKSDTFLADTLPVDLVQVFADYLKPLGLMYFDALRVSVMASGPCGVSEPLVQTYMLEKATPASNLSYTLNGISNGTDPVGVLLCGEDDMLTINPNADGTITGYHILLEKGTWDAGVFTDSGSLDSASIAVDDFPLDLAAQFSAYLYPDDTIYRGDLRVTVTTQGPCLPPAVLSQVYRIRHGEPITDLEFTVNDTFQVAALSPAPEVWMCNDTSLTLKASSNGTSGDSISITLQKGTFDTVNGFDGGFTSSITRSFAYTNSIELYDDPDFQTYLGDNPGIVQITINATGPCNVTAVSKAQVFNIRSAIATLQYLAISAVDINGNYVCDIPGLGYGHQPKHKVPTFDSLGIIQTGTPPCVSGWAGVSTVGIANGDPNFVNTAAISNYQIVVDEFSFAGDSINHFPLDSIKRVLSKTVAALPNANYDFNRNATPRDYFKDNYDSISNRYLYRVMISVTTSNCGLITDTSYFMILKGLPGNDPDYWKPAIINSIELQDTYVSIYPNPADNQIYIEFTNGIAEHTEISLINSLGQVVLKQNLELDKSEVSIGSLTPGIYHYIVAYKGSTIKGTFIKK